MENLPIDIFINEITYLPFDEVIAVCQINKKLHTYCTEYNTHWKALINNTFSSVDNYDDKLHLIWKDLGYNDGKYDYLVYTQLINYLDPITQLMIYYRQGDIKSFNNYKREQQFLSLFLLNKKDVIINYLPSDAYLPFINLLKGQDIPGEILDKMLIEMAKQGNILGIKYFQGLGANIHAIDSLALKFASENGHLPVVKYLVENGANIHALNDEALKWASLNGHLPVVKYLI